MNLYVVAAPCAGDWIGVARQVITAVEPVHVLISALISRAM